MTRRSIIANEFALPKQAVRADLAILADQFIGVEVKSNKDSLKRLKSQISAYKLHFDLVILVLTNRHISSLNSHDYRDIEIMEVDALGRIQTLSKPCCQNAIDDSAFLNLLTKAERYRFLDRILRTENSKPEGSRNLPTARQAFKAAFDERFRERSACFWSRVGRRRKIQVQDLEHLSRYKEQRQAASLWKDQRRKRWDDLIIQFGELPHSVGEIA